MRNKTKIIISIALVVVIIVCGVYIPIAKSQGKLSKGNAEKYSVANSEKIDDSPIKGKTIIFLGSSVTYGSASKGESMADYLQKQDGIIVVKEAVSSTTLVDEKDDSYVSRLKKIDKSLKPDALICQLSTNDAKKHKPLGEVSDSKSIDDFDTKTVAGAIEYIIAYSQQVWGCKVVFYTGTRYNSDSYDDMVKLLLDIQKKWDIGVIDMWNNEKMNSISKKDYNIYMANGIHPTRAGYRDWWTPQFRNYLYDNL